MPTINADIDIALPVRVVYNQWTQFESYAEFMSAVKSIRQLDDTHLFWEVVIGGVERSFETEIIEQLPDKRIAWRSIGTPTNAGVVSFQVIDDERTRVSLRLEWEPQGFVETMGAALQIDEAQVGGDLRRFARLMENQGFATGGWRGTV